MSLVAAVKATYEETGKKMLSRVRLMDEEETAEKNQCVA